MILALFGCLVACRGDYDVNSINGVKLAFDTGKPAQGQDVSTLQEDSSEKEMCYEEVTAFDIEEVSAIQDAVSGARVGCYRDAVVLSYDPDEFGSNINWRISAVEILVLIPSEQFDSYTDGQEISVEVFDANNPNNVDTWMLTQQVVRSQLTWSDYQLPADAAVAGTFMEFEQKGAWMSFSFDDQMPEGGMSSANFIVGVRWPSPAEVTVGYSNYNQSCSKNWTEFGEGTGWVLNSTQVGGNSCSWPMLRVSIENRYNEVCE